MAKTMWNNRVKKSWDDLSMERDGARFCGKWSCCPADWNRRHPENPITHKDWQRLQGRLNSPRFWRRPGRAERYVNVT